MDIAEIRRENLRRLMNEMFEGKQSKIADALEKSPNYISRCLSLTMAAEHRKKIGEDFAREIEEKLNRPRYSLDMLPAQDQRAGDLDAEKGRPAAGESAFSPSSGASARVALGKTLFEKVTPRSKALIDRIVALENQGRLRDDDLRLLEQILKRFGGA